MKTKKYKTNTFIHGTYIPHDLCDELIEYFNFNKKYHIDGAVGRHNNGIIDKNVKESTEILLSKGNFDGVIGEYRNKLKIALDNYLDVYKSANEVFFFDINEHINFQKYPVGGGFKIWHMENTGDRAVRNRHLVFMTYLNDIDDGGTEFFYQNLKTKAEKGLTLIWPAGWTHLHRGIVSQKKEKYIITGWYSFIRDGANNA